MKVVKNTTGSPIIVNDVGQVTIAASPGSYTIPPQDYDLWSASANADAYIAAGTLVVNDGYDDLKPEFGKRHIQEEGMDRDSAFIATGTVQATAASTLTLTATSRLVYIFTGTTAGQIVKLPNATTLQVCHRYEIWNTSTQAITIQNNGSTAVFVMAAQQKTWVTLQDNSTTDGMWLFEANFLGGTGGGNGTIGFGFDGNASTGRWLESLTNIASNYTPVTIAGAKAIRSISFGIRTSSTITATILKNGVALDTITISAGVKNTKLNLNHILVDKDTLSAQITSGSGERPVLIVWL